MKVASRAWVMRCWTAGAVVSAASLLRVVGTPGRRRVEGVDVFHEGQHPGVDHVRVVDLRAVPGRGDDLGAGPGYQARYALQLPLRVYEQAVLAHDDVQRGPYGPQRVLGERQGCGAADSVCAGAELDPLAHLGDGDDRLVQPLGEPGAQGLGGEGGEEADEDPGEEAQADLLQAAGVERGDGGESFGPWWAWLRTSQPP